MWNEYYIGFNFVDFVICILFVIVGDKNLFIFYFNKSFKEVNRENSRVYLL